MSSLTDMWSTVKETVTSIKETVVARVKSAVNTLSQAASTLYAKGTPVLRSIKTTVFATYEAMKNGGSGSLFALSAIFSGLKSSAAFIKLLLNLLKMFFYNAPKIAVNELYYDDKAATQAAQQELEENGADIEPTLTEAFKQLKAMLVSSWDATASTVNATGHAASAVCHASTGAVQTASLVAEGLVATATALYNTVYLPSFNGTAMAKSPAVIAEKQPLERLNPVTKMAAPAA